MSNKRELFVFAGQSNQQGAASLPPENQIEFNDIFEYLHKPRRFGEEKGVFKNYGYPAGEFSYKDIKKAYGDCKDWKIKSELDDFHANAYFAPSFCDSTGNGFEEITTFGILSEKTFKPAPCLAPILMKKWENLGYKAAYSVISMGATSIMYYFNEEMLKEYNNLIAEYNKQNSTEYVIRGTEETCFGASAYFDEKVKDFFADAKDEFKGDDLSEKVFVWLQGERDYYLATPEYKLMLKVLWKHAKSLGFKRFMCIRVGFFGHFEITNIMRAQEEFCQENPDAYMVTRMLSNFPVFDNECECYVKPLPKEEYTQYRDFYKGFKKNWHFNGAAFDKVTTDALPNFERVLRKNLQPVLEEENIKVLR